MAKQRTTFISYSRKDAKVVDELERIFLTVGLTFVRDVRDLQFGGGIPSFMESIRLADSVVVIISDSFLRSSNCLFEMLELMSEEDFRGRLTPITLDPTTIADPKKMAEYVAYWEGEATRLASKTRRLDPKNAGPLMAHVNLYSRIAGFVGEFIRTIRDIRHLSLSELRLAYYRPLIEALGCDRSTLIDRLFEINGMSPEARKVALDEFIANHPGHAAGLFFKAHFLQEMNDYQNALRFYDKAINARPDYANAYNNRGVIHHKQGRLHRAIQDYNYAIKFLPEFAEAYYNRALSHQKLGRTEQALQDYGRLLQLNPGHKMGYYNRGSLWSELGAHESARENLSMAIELDGEFADAFMNRGNAHLALGNLDQALQDHNKAIELGAENALAYVNRGAVLCKLGRIKEGLRDLEMALELDPKNPTAYHNRGSAFSDLGDFRHALEMFNEALRLKPSYKDAYYNRGNCYVKMSRLEEAIDDFGKAIELDVTYLLPYLNRGSVYCEMGQFAEAIHDFDKAIEIEPRNSVAYYNRGAARMALGNNAEACSDWACARDLGLEAAHELLRKYCGK